MYYSEEFINKVKSHVDLLELVSNYTTMKKSGEGIYSGTCPHPEHDDDTPSFVVYNKNVDDQNWCCYGCHCDRKRSEEGKFLLKRNYGSDCFAFMMWVTSGSDKPMSFVQALEYLAAYVNIPLEEDRFKSVYRANKKQADVNHKSLMNNTDALSYLFSRGLNGEDIRYYYIGYNSKSKRISFPLPNIDSNIVGFSERVMPGSLEDKYINSPSSDWFKKKQYMYGMNSIDKSFPYVFITEGTFDHILPTKYGVKNVLSTLGCSFSEFHAQFIKRIGLIPIFCQDNDDAGRDSMYKSANLMADVGVNSKVCILDYGKDMAEMAYIYRENLSDHLIKKSQYFGHYYLSKMFEKFDKEMYDIRMNYLPQAMELIDKMPSKEERELLKYEMYQKMGGKAFSDML